MVKQNHEDRKQNCLPHSNQKSQMRQGGEGRSQVQNKPSGGCCLPRIVPLQLGPTPKFPSLLNKLPNYESFNNNLLMGSEPQCQITVPEDFFWMLLHWKWSLDHVSLWSIFQIKCQCCRQPTLYKQHSGLLKWVPVHTKLCTHRHGHKRQTIKLPRQSILS